MSQGQEAIASDQIRIVKKYTPLVRSIVNGFMRKVPSNVERDDLIQVGLVGLLDAAHRFDPDQGVSFETFAGQRIRGAVLDELRGMDPLSRAGRKFIKDSEEAKNELNHVSDGKPTGKQIAKKLGLSLSEYYEMVASHSTDLVSQDAGWEAEGSVDWSERISGREIDDPAVLLEELQVADPLRCAIDTLPKRERDVLVLHADRDATLSEIGDQWGVTGSRACQLYAQAVGRCQDYLTKVAGGIFDDEFPVSDYRRMAALLSFALAGQEIDEGHTLLQGKPAERKPKPERKRRPPNSMTGGLLGNDFAPL